jgi:hypothetical protein
LTEKIKGESPFTAEWGNVEMPPEKETPESKPATEE